MIFRNENPFVEEFDMTTKFRANREYKSSLFAFLFTHDKNNLLSLYNSINDSNYTNINDISYEMLDNALFIRMKNDVSFIIDKTLNLYEHQSSYNPNMPLRGLLYFADLYMRTIDKHKLFRSTLVKIPIPKYVVFYNGIYKDDVPDKSYLRLSDAFDCDVKPEGYEWTATMLNINSGHNKKILESCNVLAEYASFVSCVRKYNCDYDLKNAILKAIEESINNGILVDVLSKFRNEVAAMIWTEFDEEAFNKSIEDEIADKDAALAKINAELSEKEALLIHKTAALADKDAALADKDAALADKDKLIQQMAEEIKRLKSNR